MVRRDWEERKGGGKGMEEEEGGGDRLGGTEMMDGAAETEPYPAFCMLETLERVEAWKKTEGGSVCSDGKSVETKHL